MKRSKVTGYAALNIVNVLYITTFKALFQPSMTIFIARIQKLEDNVKVTTIFTYLLKNRAPLSRGSLLVDDNHTW